MTRVIRKILITGATGFVGQALCKALVHKDVRIQVLLRHPTDINKMPKGLRAETFIGSLDDYESLRKACEGVSQVIHLAGIAHVASKQDTFISTNVIGTQRLLKAALQANVKRFVFLSSSLARYAELDCGDVTYYGKSKLKAEQLLYDASKNKEIEIAIIRSVNVYGPGMKGNIIRMIKLIDKGILPPLPNIKNRLSLISSYDLSAALIATIEAKTVDARPITVTDGIVYSTQEIEQAIYAILGKPQAAWRPPFFLLYSAALIAGVVSFITGKGSLSTRTYHNLTNDSVFSNDEAFQALNFKPTKTFYELLPQIIEISLCKVPNYS